MGISVTPRMIRSYVDDDVMLSESPATAPQANGAVERQERVFFELLRRECVRRDVPVRAQRLVNDLARLNRATIIGNFTVPQVSSLGAQAMGDDDYEEVD